MWSTEQVIPKPFTYCPFQSQELKFATMQAQYLIQILGVYPQPISEHQTAHIPDLSLEEITLLWSELYSMEMECLEDFLDPFHMLIKRFGIAKNVTKVSEVEVAKRGAVELWVFNRHNKPVEAEACIIVLC
ncbi:hypothetical protein MHYP_G00266140 [Metynnis hypsauchen]